MAGRGIFIVFDGIDGAGKTTQVQYLAAALRCADEAVVVSKEPTDGPWGSLIRASATTGRMPLEQELDAFIRDREEHLEKTVLPALEQDRIVILDRYFYSTIAYQGLRGGNVEELERQVRAMARTPDIGFVVDTDPKTAVARITARDGRPNEFEKEEELVRIRRIFLQLCRQDPVLRRIDGNASQASVHAEIVALLLEGVLRRRRCTVAGGCEEPFACRYRIEDTCRWWRLRNALTPDQ